MFRLDPLPVASDNLPPGKYPFEDARPAMEMPPELVSRVGDLVRLTSAVKDSQEPEEEWDHGGCPT